MRFLKVHFLALAIIGASFSLNAENCCRPPAMLSLGIGSYNIVRDNRTVQYQLEYKWPKSFYGIQPFTSLFVTNHESVYFCAGACYDFFLPKNIVITLGFAPGVYSKGKGKDLGFPIEFRSSIALAYQFKNCDRIILQFYHISNASLGHRNPGAESLVLSYGIAFN